MNIGNQLGKLKKSDQFCIYLRKSRADAEAEKLGEGETLARHERILTELAVKLGLPIGKIYRELVSGETISARKEIQSMINDCYAGMWKGILVVEVTRLSRGNQGDAQTIMDCLRYSNNKKLKFHILFIIWAPDNIVCFGWSDDQNTIIIIGIS